MKQESQQRTHSLAFDVSIDKSSQPTSIKVRSCLLLNRLPINGNKFEFAVEISYGRVWALTPL